MATIKKTEPKFDKKATRAALEIKLTAYLAEIVNGSEISKHLHKKIKKAGKLLSDGIEENITAAKEMAKKASVKAAKSAKKAAPKKTISKKAAAKVASKKTMPKKSVPKKAETK